MHHIAQLWESGYANSAATGVVTATFVLTLNILALYSVSLFVANEVNHVNQVSIRAAGLVMIALVPSLYVFLGVVPGQSNGLRVMTLFGATLFVINFIGAISLIRRFREAYGRYEVWRYWLDGDANTKYSIVVRSACRYNYFRETVFFSAVVVFGLLQESANSYDLPIEREKEAAGFVIAGIASLFVLGITEPLFRWFYPGDVLIGECFRLRLTDTPFKTQADGTQMGRWRSQRHRSNFKISRSIEACVRVMRKRVCEDDFKQLAHAYSAVALKFQKHCFGRHQEDYPIDEALRWSCVSLVVNDNPVRVARRIAKIVHVDTSIVPAYLDSRYKRVLNNINTAIESHRLIITTAVPSLIIIYYLSNGDFEPLLKFVKSMVGGS